MKAGNRFISGVLLVCAACAIVFFPGLGFAGSLEPSAPPAPTMHTLDEIYNKLLVIEQNISLLTSNNSGTTGGTANPYTSSQAATFGATKVNVEWEAFGLTADAYNIYRSSSSGTLGTKVATTAGNITHFQDTGLTPSTTYYYTIESFTGASGVKSSQVTVTTGAIPMFPAPLTGLSATRNGNIVTLSWDNYTGAASYEVYRSVIPEIQPGTGFSMTNLYGPFTTSVNDIIAGNGRYSYMVIVYDTGATQSASARIDIDVPAGTLPGVESPVLNIWSTTSDASVAHVYWWAAPGADAHHVYAAPQVTNGVIPNITPKQGGSGVFDSVARGYVPYEVRPGYFGIDIRLDDLLWGYDEVCVAVEAVKGNYAADSEAICFLVYHPSPVGATVGVTNVRTEQRNPTTLDVSWDAAAGAATYNVYRLGSPKETAGAANYVATTTDTTYHNTGLTPDTTYYYRIIAITGNGTWSNPSDFAVGKTLFPKPNVWYYGKARDELGDIVGCHARLGWISLNNDSGPFKIYGDASAVLLDISRYNLVSPLPFYYNHYDVYANQVLCAARGASWGAIPIFGHYWVTEIYPDGTESEAAEFPVFLF